jgi:putative cofactor-binding repeat protein
LSGTQTLAKTGGSYTWVENPVLASNVIINASVPVTLYLASDATATRNVEVRLACSSATGTYLSSGNMTETNMPATATQYTFTLTAANGTATLPMTCAAGNSWQLTVINQSTGAGTRNVIVYPMSGTNNSYVSLPSQNVINVNSIGLYSAAYPGGSIVSSVITGNTVYIRVVVSDPFGSYDIVNLPTITIKNPSGTAIVTAAQ